MDETPAPRRYRHGNLPNAMRAAARGILDEAGPEGVVNGVINDGLTGRADGIDLFETAIAAAHASGENEKSWFLHWWHR